MDYKVLKGRILLRLDRGEELLSNVIGICEKEGVHSALFHGIGAFGSVCIATYIPETESFLDHKKSGLLELISLDGNISHEDDGRIFEHTHAVFSFLNEKESPVCFGGHLKKAVVSYTAEIEITPIRGEGIGRMVDPVTGIIVWKLNELFVEGQTQITSVRLPDC